MNRPRVQSWPSLRHFDDAVTDACDFLGLNRQGFFAEADGWIAAINALERIDDVGAHYVEAPTRHRAGWICANLALQFSSPALWEAFAVLFPDNRGIAALDFGCGTAAPSYAHRQYFSRLYLCDVANPVQEFVRWRARRDGADNVTVLTPDQLDRLPEVQLLMLCDVLEHLPDASAVFAATTARLARQGWLFLNAPWASRMPIAEHIPEAEADWHKPGGGAARLARDYRCLKAWGHGGVYGKL
jgi:2-polyprenyl-3-methyl-5-hydroxy-6-metoxy-1,4-benzoquinol methylase